MDDLDKLVGASLVPFRNRTNQAALERYPLFAFMQNNFFAAAKRLALIVTESGVEIGRYTLHVEGPTITGLERGINKPYLGFLGLLSLKPLFIIEKSTIDAMIAGEEQIIKDPLLGFRRFLPGIKVRWCHDA